MPTVLLAQFGQSAFGDQPSSGDHADAVGHSLGDFENMCGHNYGAAGEDAIVEQSFDVPGGNCIEPDKRLVKDDQPGPVHQRADVWFGSQ